MSVPLILGSSIYFRELHDRHEYAPRSGRFVFVENQELFIQEDGPVDGKTVVLIHGTGAWSEIWRETMNSLVQNNYRVIAIDLPPFGYSEKLLGVEEYSREKQAKRIVSLLTLLNKTNVILVGHSVGARPTIEAALTGGIRVGGMVLVDPALGIDKNSLVFEQNNPSFIITSLFGIRPLRNVLVGTFGTNPLFTKMLFTSFVTDKTAVTDARVSMLHHPLYLRGISKASADWLEYIVTSKDTSLSSIPSNLQKLRIPVSIIWGKEDTITPLSESEAIRYYIPNATLEIIEGAGHIPYIERSKEFQQKLLHVLSQMHQ